MRRVLRGDDEKRARQGARFAFGGDLALLHGFEQGALGFRGGPVDFVGENQLRKDRAGQETEFAALAVEDRDAGDVGRQQVAGELDAGELQAEQAGQSMGQGSLAEAWQIFDQQVAAGKQAGCGESDFVRLAENDFVGASEHGVEGAGANGG